MPEVKSEWKPVLVRRVPSPDEIRMAIHNHYFEFGQFSGGHEIGICCYNGSHSPGNPYNATMTRSFGFGKAERQEETDSDNESQ